MSNASDASSGSSLRYLWPRGIMEHQLPLSKGLKYRNKTKGRETNQDFEVKDFAMIGTGNVKISNEILFNNNSPEKE